jgi:hypothetical protein
MPNKAGKISKRGIDTDWFQHADPHFGSLRKVCGACHQLARTQRSLASWRPHVKEDFSNKDTSTPIVLLLAATPRRRRGLQHKEFSTPLSLPPLITAKPATGSEEVMKGAFWVSILVASGFLT